jgi:hypothetical protein
MPGVADSAAKIAADKIAPALDRQIAELEAHRGARRAMPESGNCRAAMSTTLGVAGRDHYAHDAG